MHSTDTKNRFLELRAQGWSLARIADHLNVSKRTLVDWNQHSQTELRILRSVELEALHEKLLASHEAELTQLTVHLKRIEDELNKRELQFVSTENLFRLAGQLRQQLQQLRASTGPGDVLNTPPSTAAA
jgi:orotate phosphoribosyltransferase-like protein